MSTPITSFNNIQIASNEAIDYYTVNRAFSRLYDVITTVSGNTTVPLTGAIPYATLNSPGFVQFTPTSAVSGVYDNKIISATAMNTFMNSIELTAANTVSLPTTSNPAFYVTTGGGKLLNNMKFQYGYTTVSCSAGTILSQRVGVNELIIPFATSNVYSAFTQIPHVMYQVLDNNAISFALIGAMSHLVELSSVTTSGCTLMITNSVGGGTPPSGFSLSAYNFYLTWLAMGV